MNVTKPPTHDHAVREAVSWAVDRKTIVEKVFFGVHHATVGPLSEGVWARDESIEKMFAFDPARAKKILDDAGWKLGSGPIRQKSGQNLEILLVTFRSPWTEIAQALQSQLRDVGIDLKIQPLERGPYLDLVRSYKHNMAATSSTSIDPDGILRVCYHSSNRGSGSNFSNLADPALEALTIVLAVGTTRGWRGSLAGTALAALTLAVIVTVLGVALVTYVDRHVLQLVVGVLLLLFGLRWLRKAILRYAGVVALHDEELIYWREVAELRAQGL